MGTTNLYIVDNITDQSADSLVERVNATTGELVVHIKSGGGLFTAAKRIREAIAAHSSASIAIHQFAGGAAAYIATAGCPVAMHNDAKIAFAWPTTSIAAHQAQFDQAGDEMANAIASRCEVASDEAAGWMKLKRSFVAAAAAIKCGLVDHVFGGVSFDISTVRPAWYTPAEQQLTHNL